jgi:hypothetical protein
VDSQGRIENSEIRSVGANPFQNRRNPILPGCEQVFEKSPDLKADRLRVRRRRYIAIAVGALIYATPAMFCTDCFFLLSSLTDGYPPKPGMRLEAAVVPVVILVTGAIIGLAAMLWIERIARLRARFGAGYLWGSIIMMAAVVPVALFFALMAKDLSPLWHIFFTGKRTDAGDSVGAVLSLGPVFLSVALAGGLIGGFVGRKEERMYRVVEKRLERVKVAGVKLSVIVFFIVLGTSFNLLLLALLFWRAPIFLANRGISLIEFAFVRFYSAGIICLTADRTSIDWVIDAFDTDYDSELDTYIALECLNRKYSLVREPYISRMVGIMLDEDTYCENMRALASLVGSATGEKLLPGDINIFDYPQDKTEFRRFVKLERENILKWWGKRKKHETAGAVPGVEEMKKLSRKIDNGDSAYVLWMFEAFNFKNGAAVSGLRGDRKFRLYSGVADAYFETGDCGAANYILKIAGRFAPAGIADEEKIDEKYLGTSKVEEIGKVANQTVNFGRKDDTERPKMKNVFTSPPVADVMRRNEKIVSACSKKN